MFLGNALISIQLISLGVPVNYDLLIHEQLSFHNSEKPGKVREGRVFIVHSIGVIALTEPMEGVQHEQML